MNTPIEHIKVETRPIKWLIDLLKKNSIRIDNSYQRRYVWVKKDKIALIETILLGYPIPEVYLWQNATDPNTGETIYSLVDGQQRLGAVLSFINDEFKLSKNALENCNNEYVGLSFSQLSNDLKSEIWKYSFSVRFLDEKLSKDDIIALFLRLNRTNATLNPQELRNAEFSGKFIEAADQISRLPVWKEIGIFTSTDYRRMTDIQFISTLLMFLRSGIEEETTQSSINKHYDLYNEKYPDKDNDLALFKTLIEIIMNLAYKGDAILTALSKKTHFYTMFAYSYYIHSSKKADLTDSITQRLDDWFSAIQNGLSLPDPEMNDLLKEYNKLTQEGVQKKHNRMKRLEIIKKYCGL